MLDKLARYHQRVSSLAREEIMQLIDRVQRNIGKRWYTLMPTEKLIALVGNAGSAKSARVLIETLKERLAHQDGSLDHVDWTSAALTDALLSSCRMQYARLATGQLRGAYFGYSDLRWADFRMADLREAHFREARLARSNFDRANLDGANFARAELTGASFLGASLTDANFWGADIRGANFSGSSMARCHIAKVIVDETTIMPDGEPYRDCAHWDRVIAAKNRRRA